MSAHTAAPPAPANTAAAPFFLRYLGRELGRRARQATVIALGLALGIGLVITVSAAAAGVKNAQAKVLHSLYGVGTDITVTQKPSAGSGTSHGGSLQIQVGPGGSKVCTNGVCHSGAQTVDNLIGTFSDGPLSYSLIAEIDKLHDVTAAAGGLSLNDNQIHIPASVGPSTQITPPSSFTVQGVDLEHANLGPLSAGTLTSGHSFTPSETDADVAVVDSDYAIANKLKVGSHITVAKHQFTIIGIVSQPEASSPPQVYIPLARAQALAKQGPGGGSLKNDVNTIYVTAASASDISAVQKEISALLPKATVTTPASLASELTGSLASAAKLAGDLGTWLSILVLIVAFAVASLLTMAAVTRRAREFGTLKAIGWRTRRITGQVMAESVGIGLAGGLAGIGLGLAGIAIINAIAPKLSATLTTPTGQRFFAPGPGGGGPVSSSPTITHTVPVPWSATVTIGIIGLAVLLAIAGGLLAGAFGSWRIAQLRPADALARVD
jgi:putative ABC transport system permease protein